MLQPKPDCPAAEQCGSEQVSAAPSLAELQARFQAAILAGDDTVLDFIPGNGRTTREVLLGVYRHAYWARLVEIMAADFEQLRKYLGEGPFDTMARAYTAAHPSQTQNARWFSHALPEFLAAAKPYREHPQLAELAAIERALSDVFDAPDAPAVALADIQAIDPGEWHDLVLTPSPAVVVLELETAAAAIWQAMADDAEPPPAGAGPAGGAILIWRQGTTPRLRPFPAEEAMVWEEASRGATFGRLCEIPAFYDDAESAPMRAAQHLAGWLQTGLIAAAEVVRPAPEALGLPDTGRTEPVT